MTHSHPLIPFNGSLYLIIFLCIQMTFLVVQKVCIHRHRTETGNYLCGVMSCKKVCYFIWREG